MQNEDIKAMDLTELLSSEEQYAIPIYQRNYAWGSKEIEQLIQDIIDYSIYHPDKNYYIGTLVVAAEKNKSNDYFNTIDGQQRLTTLSILSAVIKNRHKEIKLDWFTGLNIRYESREKSTLSMNAAFDGNFDGTDYELNIKAAYEICSKELTEKTKENNISIKQFASYLYKYVKILRVPLPNGIDLNHYFEIMNSRGEQLEKHEILKARLMQCFNSLEKRLRDKYSSCFNLVWEACSNMEKYLQYGFTTEQRHEIFGMNNWNTIAVSNFDEIVDKVFPLIKNFDTIEVSIDEIINEMGLLTKKDNFEDNPDKFNSVINFQNFLLQVLRVQTAEDSVALDDKRLLDIFEKNIKGTEEERIAFVKDFIYNLLKCKFLFDKYIIKREFTANTDRWSLKCLKWYNSGKVKNGVKYVNTFGDEQSDSFDSDNRKVLMLLSMFHVSIPSMPYKHWLNAALNYLFNQFEIESKEYISYLEHIAKSFVFDRYLAKQTRDYFPMIYENFKPVQRNLDQLNLGKLLYGNIENNLVFNFVDYLLWLEFKDIEKDKRVKAFEFTFRSSVEHYYPQIPINSDTVKIKDVYLHSFGNLCLISHEKNSRLNNLPPEAKKGHYNRTASLDSLKQFLMIEKSTWFIKEIEAHNEFIVDLLCNNMNSNFIPNEEISFAKRWFKKWQIKDRVLLAKTLLCFGDCSKHINGNKYNLFEFDFIKEQEAFKRFEDYINEITPKNPNDVLNHFLNSSAELHNDWRYLFIKFPSVLDYCKEGNFTWEEDGRLIFLLKSGKKSLYKAKEIYTSIIQNYFFEKFKIKSNCNRDCLFFNIGYSPEGYFITENYNEASFHLIIWNNKGYSIEHSIESKVNGNRKAIKLLYDYKWEKNSTGNFNRFGKSLLLKLGNNYEENISNAIEGVIKLLKNGLKIKL